ncbi:bacteriocin [Streptococcus jiangjianxini]|uniref:bacteriocin n=1 Tax=Streptococcus jiangjianxini TaxID=3161189 RepID=UPI0032F063B5
MNEMVLSGIEGGKNNWASNVLGLGGSISAGYALGAAICSGTVVATPACGYIGAKVIGSAWAAATSATGGFLKRGRFDE